MGLGGWLRVLQAVGGLTELSRQVRPRAENATGGQAAAPAPGAPGSLEARLAGVLVAALQEAFDRDRARLDLERAQVESERRRADEALALELRRQAAERSAAQARLLALLAAVVWIVTMLVAVWLPGMRGTPEKAVLGAGWACVLASLGVAFAWHQRVAEWAAAVQPGGDQSALPAARAGTAAAALLVGGAALVALAIVLAL
jgi:hypothetical protein